MCTIIASASDDKITVVTSDKGVKGDTGTDGIDGLGFNNVRFTLLDNPLMHIMKSSNVAVAGIGGVNWDRSTVATGFNKYSEFATAGVDIPREETNGWRIEGASENLFLESATAATQDITVTSNTYTLSFFNTGTVTLSGAFSGSLVGTGANDRVSLTFAASAGTLTCAVSGTVEKAQVELGSFATSYFPTLSTPLTRSADRVTLPAAGNAPSFANDFSVYFNLYIDDSQTNTVLSVTSDLVFAISGTTITATFNGSTCTGTITLDAKNNICLVKNGTNLTLYIDSTLAQQQVGVSGITTDTASTIVAGGIVADATDNMFGWLNDVRLYEFALNIDEITYLGGC